MDFSDAVLLIQLGALLGGLLLWRFGRRCVDRSDEMEALQACLRLSLALWQARQELERAALHHPRTEGRQ